MFSVCYEKDHDLISDFKSYYFHDFSVNWQKYLEENKTNVNENRVDQIEMVYCCVRMKTWKLSKSKSHCDVTTGDAEKELANVMLSVTYNYKSTIVFNKVILFCTLVTIFVHFISTLSRLHISYQF